MVMLKWGQRCAFRLTVKVISEGDFQLSVERVIIRAMHMWIFLYRKNSTFSKTWGFILQVYKSSVVILLFSVVSPSIFRHKPTFNFTESYINFHVCTNSSKLQTRLKFPTTCQLHWDYHALKFLVPYTRRKDKKISDQSDGQLRLSSLSFSCLYSLEAPTEKCSMVREVWPCYNGTRKDPEWKAVSISQ